MGIINGKIQLMLVIYQGKEDQRNVIGVKD